MAVSSTQIIGVGLAAAILGPIVLHFLSPPTLCGSRERNRDGCMSQEPSDSVLPGIFIATSRPLLAALKGAVGGDR